MNTKKKHPEFVPGLELAEGFFNHEVKPILKNHQKDLLYSAALIGSGSEVLEFDTEMSTDHHWGPRVMLFLSPDDFNSKRDVIRVVLNKELPTTYLGYSTNYSVPDDKGVQNLQPIDSGPINHRVETYTVDGFFSNYLNIDMGKKLEPVEWLTLPHHKLRSVISGRVFRDDLGLKKIQARFFWYPHDVWLYLLASAWKRIGQEEHLMGRAGLLGDEKGSSIIGSRLVRDIMRLTFLMERKYPPYAKWFGTAFSQLKYASKLEPVLTNVLHATSWEVRETDLCAAFELLVGIHNSLEITTPIFAEVSQFFERPFKIIQGEKIAETIITHIKNIDIASLAKRRLIGNIDLISDNTDFLMDKSLASILKALYT